MTTRLWNNQDPTSTDFVLDGDDAILRMKIDIQERMEIDHIWGEQAATGSGQDGVHKKLTLSPIPLIEKPPAFANAKSIYRNSEGMLTLLDQADVEQEIFLEGLGLGSYSQWIEREPAYFSGQGRFIALNTPLYSWSYLARPLALGGFHPYSMRGFSFIQETVDDLYIPRSYNTQIQFENDGLYLIQFSLLGSSSFSAFPMEYGDLTQYYTGSGDYLPPTINASVKTIAPLSTLSFVEENQLLINNMTFSVLWEYNSGDVFGLRYYATANSLGVEDCHLGGFYHQGTSSLTIIQVG